MRDSKNSTTANKRQVNLMPEKMYNFQNEKNSSRQSLSNYYTVTVIIALKNIHNRIAGFDLRINISQFFVF